MDKLWGTTEALVKGPLCEVHRINVVYGGYCSWHEHAKKSNAFIVVSGILEVDIAAPGVKPDPVYERRGQVTTVTLHGGDFISIPSTVYHRFRAATTPVEAYEVYFPDELGPEDIKRLDTGGVVL